MVTFHKIIRQKMAARGDRGFGDKPSQADFGIEGQATMKDFEQMWVAQGAHLSEAAQTCAPDRVIKAPIAIKIPGECLTPLVLTPW